MQLEIVSPESTLLTADVDSVVVPGTDGSFQMLDNHAPIVSTLISGTIKILGELYFICINEVVLFNKKNMDILIIDDISNILHEHEREYICCNEFSDCKTYLYDLLRMMPSDINIISINLEENNEICEKYTYRFMRDKSK